MNFIKCQHLPESNAKYVVCDNRIGKDIINELNLLGCNIIFVASDKNLDKPVNAHPDIHMFHIGGPEFITSKTFYDILNDNINNVAPNKLCEKINNRVIDKNLDKEYPYDVLLNAVSVGEYLICNKKTIFDYIMLTNKKIINVSQGYTKCSICVVSDSAIITDDMGIYKETKDKLDVLLVAHGEIILPGYNYGFFGGCCGKIAKDNLAFYGCIENFSMYHSINSFCRNHGVYCTSLSKKPLQDFGTLIPIIE